MQLNTLGFGLLLHVTLRCSHFAFATARLQVLRLKLCAGPPFESWTVVSGILSLRARWCLLVMMRKRKGECGVTFRRLGSMHTVRRQGQWNAVECRCDDRNRKTFETCAVCRRTARCQGSGPSRKSGVLKFRSRMSRVLAFLSFEDALAT